MRGAQWTSVAFGDTALGEVGDALRAIQPILCLRKREMCPKKRPPELGESDRVEVGELAVPGVRLRRICAGHDGWIGRIAWSPCGRFIASPSFDKTIRVWDAEASSSVAVLKGHARGVNCVAWSSDGEMLGSSGENIRVWRAGDFELAHVLQNSEGYKRLDWSPNGPIIVGASVRNITFWDISTGGAVHSSDCPTREGVVAWSPRAPNPVVAAMGEDLCLWNHWKNAPPVIMQGHQGSVVCLAWSPDGGVVASGAGDSTIRIWDVENARQIRVLEGHSGWVCELSFSADGSLLSSKASDGTVRIWRCHDWGNAAVLKEPGPAQVTGLAFHPSAPVLCTCNYQDDSLYLWQVDVEALLEATPTEKLIRYTSAKIVLVGESNVGKSCLAMRLVEDRYPEDHEHGTTHGMRFWSIDAEDLHPAAKAPLGQRRDVVLWDFGGQDEYRLVHQLFLHDTTLALILIDPTRGRVAFDEAVAWNRRLEKRLGNRKAVKLLVGAKQDKPSEVVNMAAIDRLCEECGFVGYYETSAKTGRKIKTLRKAIAQALDWDNLAKTSRPKLFQRIRDEIETRRKKGEVVLLLDDLTQVVRETSSKDVEPAKVRAVSEQLATQGAIALTRLAVSKDALVLQLPVIERYACSLIVAARDNPRGVPALEERLLGSAQLPLPGMTKKERLHTMQERIVLECVVELMIEHGICFRREGLLVFPTLFPETQVETAERLPHSVSLYYDFTGAIDSVYASLVARLVTSQEFGEGRLWPGRFEFDEPSRGVCGVQHIKYPGGLAHIDVFFAEDTDPERRGLFTRFVEGHLRQYGVEVREHQAIKCRGCGRDVSEDVVHANMEAGRPDVVCQWCRTQTLISEGVAKIRERDPRSDQKIYALRMEIEKRTALEAEKAKQAVATGKRRPSRTHEPIRVVHLSDLHFAKDTSPKAKAHSLLQDIREGDTVRADSVDYLVISGDMTDKGSEEGLEKAREFVSTLNEELGISAERCIFVPGNHDVEDMEEAYQWYTSETKARKAEPDESSWHREGNAIFVPNADMYPNRLKKFSDAFYHKIIQKPYPLDPGQQGNSYLFADTRIQFLSLNSSWQIDQFHRKRCGLHPDAVAHVIEQANKQLHSAIERGEVKEGQNALRFCVWHHSIQHPEMMRNTDLVEILQNANVRICLHGDVHEMNRELFKYWHANAMHVIGAGSFGSPAEGRPESMPRLYNLLEVNRDLSSVRIHTRRQPKPNGPWSGWNEWPRPDGGSGGVPYYDVDVS